MLEQCKLVSLFDLKSTINGRSTSIWGQGRLWYHRPRMISLGSKTTMNMMKHFYYKIKAFAGSSQNTNTPIYFSFSLSLDRLLVLLLETLLVDVRWEGCFVLRRVTLSLSLSLSWQVYFFLIWLCSHFLVLLKYFTISLFVASHLFNNLNSFVTFPNLG